ncbi:hypothetical protein ANN_17385 [Periplaneta americana]|uniref:MULE transposase domain-containing protein n=1 Tax=Periplaneta americana TaxID=6978 RepID=A0ABQ8SUY1_PERAM|nr:hypothetical protein ANN_17385 [Periplaneta americana]
MVNFSYWEHTGFHRYILDPTLPNSNVTDLQLQLSEEIYVDSPYKGDEMKMEWIAQEAGLCVCLNCMYSKSENEEAERFQVAEKNVLQLHHGLLSEVSTQKRSLGKDNNGWTSNGAIATLHMEFPMQRSHELHGVTDNHYVPLVFFLLQDQHEKSYTYAFNSIKQYVNPVVVYADFEKAIQNGISNIFPSAKLKVVGSILHNLGGGKFNP